MYQTVDGHPEHEQHRAGDEQAEPAQVAPGGPDRVGEDGEHRAHHGELEHVAQRPAVDGEPAQRTTDRSSRRPPSQVGVGAMPAALRARTGRPAAGDGPARRSLPAAAAARRARPPHPGPTGRVQRSARSGRAAATVAVPAAAPRGRGRSQHREREHRHRGVEAEVGVPARSSLVISVCPSRRFTASRIVPDRPLGVSSSSSLARPPTETTVRPGSAPGETRTKTRRRRITRQAMSPARASSALARVSPLPGSERIDRPAKRSTPSKVMLPRPAGSW